MTDTPAPPKPKKQRRRRMTRRTLVKILPVAAASVEALLHDEKEIGLALEAGVIHKGSTVELHLCCVAQVKRCASGLRGVGLQIRPG
jgi:hypothetical protein